MDGRIRKVEDYDSCSRPQYTPFMRDFSGYLAGFGDGKRVRQKLSYVVLNALGRQLKAYTRSRLKYTPLLRRHFRISCGTSIST